MNEEEKCEMQTSAHDLPAVHINSQDLNNNKLIRLKYGLELGTKDSPLAEELLAISCFQEREHQSTLKTWQLTSSQCSGRWPHIHVHIDNSNLSKMINSINNKTYGVYDVRRKLGGGVHVGGRK